VKLDHPHYLPDWFFTNFGCLQNWRPRWRGHRLLDAVKILGHVATIQKGIAGQGFRQCF